MTTPARVMLLAIDASTRTTTVAVGDASGSCLAITRSERGGRALLELVDDALGQAGVGIADLRAVIAGTGPGSFTGLRVGLAAAKTLAFARGIDIVGVPTVEAFARAVADAPAGERTFSIILAAGARDHYLARVALTADGRAHSPEPVALLPPGTDLRAAAGDGEAIAMGVDAEVVGQVAVELGERAVAGLGPALLAIGAARLAAGDVDDVASLVPHYVAVPRGVTVEAKEMAWSPDPR